MDLTTKVQIALWWISSIAASVFCCSILFVLFATHLVDIRGMVKDTNERISIIEAREERILNEVEIIRKRAVFQAVVPQASAVQAPADAATEAPMSLSISGDNPEKMPENASAGVTITAPASPAPADKPTAPVEKK